MPLIVTPSQLERRAELYHQLGTILAAGMTIRQGLEQLKAHPPSRSMKPAITQWLESLDAGYTVTDSVSRLGRWMPSFDLALVEAGEQSGRLDSCFKLLSGYYQERAQMARQIISEMAYPLFVFHFAIVLFPLLQLFQTGNVFQFGMTILAVLLPLYGGVIFLLYVCQGRHGEGWRSLLERIFHRVPFLGKARRYLALARLAAALEALLSAGVSILNAWDLAAAASGSPALQRVVRGWKTPFEQGSTPSEMVSAAPEFPDVFRNFYHTGEISGTLDKSLQRLHQYYQEDGSRRMRLLARMAPRLVYFGVCIYVGLRVIGFYTAYFGQVSSVMDMK
jgi:type II secretory pathway component PulF